jgi:hypothetical protein
LLSAIAKNDEISHQSRRGPSRYGWIHLLAAIVKDESAINVGETQTVHLLPAIARNGSVSHQTRTYPDMVAFTYNLQ